MQSIKAGLGTAIYTYQHGALVPITDGNTAADWDSWEARAFRYLHAQHYYWNTAYSDLQRYAQSQKTARGLYQHIRPIYNPVFRLVEGYVANVWGGSLNYDTLTEGAIPLTGLDEPLTDAVRQLWRWSNWGQAKNRAVRFGTNKGDAVLKLVTDVQRGTVRIEVVDPVIVQGVTFDAVGNVKAALIGYDKVGDDGKRYTYQEKITGGDGGYFQTLRDGELYAYPENMVNGAPVAEWANPYGFVPLVVIQHRDVGCQWGGSAYAPVLPKVDEVNDQASKTNDFIRVALNPVYYAPGVQGPGQLEFREADTGADDNDPVNRGVAVNVIYGPEGSQMTPLVPQADLAAALDGVSRMLAELEKDLPELALPSIRDAGQLTAPGVRAGFSDAVARYAEARGQYDDGLIRAHMMGISIGAYHGFSGFEPFSVDSYAAGNLEHYVEERPVINDDLSLLERITALTNSGAPEYLIWQLCGLSEEEAAAAWAEKQAMDRTLAGAFGQAVIGGATVIGEGD